MFISNHNFLEWLVGFVDGDGSFAYNSSNNSYSFRISQSGYNAYLLYVIKSYLGMVIRSLAPYNLAPRF
jgi:hypothetical protein